ncbi:MAG: response regulator [Anaerolineae bacterium]|nr:response regulator [Anaerolineae bacterium]
MLPVNPPQALLLSSDHGAIRACQTALHELGYAVAVIHEGRAALAALQQTAPDLIVLDIQLPGLSGLEILTALREMSGASVRVIVLTADVICMHLTGVQVDAELLKPIQPADLLDVLHALPEFPQTDS